MFELSELCDKKNKNQTTRLYCKRDLTSQFPPMFLHCASWTQYFPKNMWMSRRDFLVLLFFVEFLHKNWRVFIAMHVFHVALLCDLTSEWPGMLQVTSSSTLTAQHTQAVPKAGSILQPKWYLFLETCFLLLLFLPFLLLFCPYSPPHAVHWRGTSGCKRILLLHPKIPCFSFFLSPVWVINWDFQKQTPRCGKYLWGWNGGLQICMSLLKTKLTARNVVLKLK